MKKLAVVLAVVGALQAFAFAVFTYALASLSYEIADRLIGAGVLVVWLAGPGLLARRFWRQQRFGRVVAVLAVWSVLTWCLLILFGMGIYAGAA